MADFYENLSQMENEAMRRARRIHAAERRTAKQFHEAASTVPRSPQQSEHERPNGHGLPGMFGNGLFHTDLFSSPDFSLIMVLFLILKSEQSDPLLMLALVYILM